MATPPRSSAIPGISPINMAPLPSLRIYKETRWAWKGVYSGRDGREKKVTIPKAYQGFAER